MHYFKVVDHDTMRRGEHGMVDAVVGIYADGTASVLLASGEESIASVPYVGRVTAILGVVVAVHNASSFLVGNSGPGGEAGTEFGCPVKWYDRNRFGIINRLDMVTDY